MNIFVLDCDPKISAYMMCDKHVVKMVLETAQLMCSVFWANHLKDVIIPYKMTHNNHPCAIWARQSLGNFQWLSDHGFALCEEYSARYCRIHKSQSVISWCFENKGLLKFSQNDLTDFVQAMPEQYRSNDAVKSYRNYYLNEKSSFARWDKGRSSPEWFQLEF